MASMTIFLEQLDNWFYQGISGKVATVVQEAANQFRDWMKATEKQQYEPEVHVANEEKPDGPDEPSADRAAPPVEDDELFLKTLEDSFYVVEQSDDESSELSDERPSEAEKSEEQFGSDATMSAIMVLSGGPSSRRGQRQSTSQSKTSSDNQEGTAREGTSQESSSSAGPSGGGGDGGGSDSEGEDNGGGSGDSSVDDEGDADDEETEKDDDVEGIEQQMAGRMKLRSSRSTESYDPEALPVDNEQPGVVPPVEEEGPPIPADPFQEAAPENEPVIHEAPAAQVQEVQPRLEGGLPPQIVQMLQSIHVPPADRPVQLPADGLRIVFFNGEYVQLPAADQISPGRLGRRNAISPRWVSVNEGEGSSAERPPAEDQVQQDQPRLEAGLPPQVAQMMQSVNVPMADAPAQVPADPLRFVFFNGEYVQLPAAAQISPGPFGLRNEGEGSSAGRLAGGAEEAQEMAEEDVRPEEESGQPARLGYRRKHSSDESGQSKRGRTK
ncbi:unnamed protein product [Caenorhabditis sp. 36 PRJEB53466]|nr:unnamed protein product [Caenorhabditis sp. 36 PRJEB53466]